MSKICKRLKPSLGLTFLSIWCQIHHRFRRKQVLEVFFSYLHLKVWILFIFNSQLSSKQTSSQSLGLKLKDNLSICTSVIESFPARNIQQQVLKLKDDNYHIVEEAIIHSKTLSVQPTGVAHVGQENVKRLCGLLI